MKLHRKLLVLLFAFVTYPVAAQVDRATLTGTVTDSSGSVIVGARVEAVSSGTALRRETISGVNGAYELPGLPIGRYTVTTSYAVFCLKKKSIGLLLAILERHRDNHS